MLRWVAALPRGCWGAIRTLYLYVPHNTGVCLDVILPLDYRLGTEFTAYGRAIDEQVRFLRTGIDGLFTDQSDIGVIARAEFLSAKAAA